MKQKNLNLSANNADDNMPLWQFEQLSLAERQTWLFDITHRMKEAFAIKTNKALARKLNLSDKTVSQWRANGTIPMPAILLCHQLTGTSLNWLLKGEIACYPLSVEDQPQIEEAIVQFLKQAQQLSYIRVDNEVNLALLKAGLMDCLLKNL